MSDSIQFVIHLRGKQNGGHRMPAGISLHKSLTGIPSLFGPVPENAALSITNEYKDLRWPKSDIRMKLVGTEMDRKHILKFLEKFGFTTGVKLERVNNAPRKHIEDRIKKIVGSRPPLLVIHFQGHGIRLGDTVQYITEDHKEDGELEGLTGKELIKMFSTLTTDTTSLVITDFCNSGNLYRLRFQLVIGTDGPSWHETTEWENDDKCHPAFRITSPMLHIAGSLDCQQVYETRARGGYFTNSLAHLEAKPRTLPQFLLDTRRGVDGHIVATKAKFDPSARSMFQDPQVFSSDMWPLDDPQILSKIRLGTARLNLSVSS
ncbi:hypothetical protein RSOLAG22IIIB_08544 [Rhizoctonia solani]|uniref:Peptidase C14 caspase domain-containing protein n=1 Tax=Rhizoctonia solani TaxID=456999 RepID=A0A0K6FU05_9AGAM|nr:hypothetical protein RSOLAG22IIIB_08544 [Rhizoctonia solani]